MPFALEKIHTVEKDCLCDDDQDDDGGNVSYHALLCLSFDVLIQLIFSLSTLRRIYLFILSHSFSDVIL